MMWSPIFLPCAAEQSVPEVVELGGGSPYYFPPIFSPYAAEQNVLEVVELGGLPRMLKLISSPEKITRCHAIICLCLMAPYGNNFTDPYAVQRYYYVLHIATVRHLLYKSDCIPALLKLLLPEGVCMHAFHIGWE